MVVSLENTKGVTNGIIIIIITDVKNINLQIKNIKKHVLSVL